MLQADTVMIAVRAATLNKDLVLARFLGLVVDANNIVLAIALHSELLRVAVESRLCCTTRTVAGATDVSK